MNVKYINVIGAGLAGSEAAYQLSKYGYKVKLYEVKKIQKNSIQTTDYFGELVCSNSLRSNELVNAVGTLKAELRCFDSLIMQAADYAQIPAGGSLAVDRELFGQFITNKLRNNSLIEIFDKEVIAIDFNEPTIIATGPLTTYGLQKELQAILGKNEFYFYDAVAPIISKESIDMNIAFRKNRYEKGETQDYINCPLTKEQYELFYKELLKGELAISHLEEDKELKYFEGCMPVEVMAKRGEQTLLFGPLKPKGLNGLDGKTNYAVVQLRQDNAKDSLYNMVGFQTNLKFSEQKRIFSLIPSLEKAEFIRYGVMHKNNFVNSPKLLNKGLQLKTHPNVFFAGQITGVEGYVESTASGLLCALNMIRYLNELELMIPSSNCVIGALFQYITSTSSINFQPMKANWGILNELNISFSHKNKQLKRETYSKRALIEIKKFIDELNLHECKIK